MRTDGEPNRRLRFQPPGISLALWAVVALTCGTFVLLLTTMSAEDIAGVGPLWLASVVVFAVGSVLGLIASLAHWRRGRLFERRGHRPGPPSTL